MWEKCLLLMESKVSTNILFFQTNHLKFKAIQLKRERKAANVQKTWNHAANV